MGDGMKSKMDGSVVIFLGLWWPTSSSRARSSMIVIWVRVECPGMNWWVMSLCCRGYMWQILLILLVYWPMKVKHTLRMTFDFTFDYQVAFLESINTNDAALNFFFTFDTRNAIKFPSMIFWLWCVYNHGDIDLHIPMDGLFPRSGFSHLHLYIQ